ncbi:FHA domain protein [Alteromonadaceae bacterium Bs31]|nr:FHA domain protein [Alteromonadaceae bacterium Bs31]
MVLKVEITQSPAGANVNQSSQTFSEQGGSIGRGEDNTWILQDPDKFLSSRHCELTSESGLYYLTDTSTNGTFLNGAAEPIGRGNRVPLNQGDVFELGDYKFSVSMEGLGDPFTSAPADPFSVPASPFDAPEPAPLAPANDFFSSAPGLNVGSPLESAETDPLAALDKVAPMPDPFTAPSDPFSGESLPAAESFPYGQNSFNEGGGDPLAASFEAPRPSAAGAIPEDWEEDEDWLNGGASERAPVQPPVAPPPAPTPRPRRPKAPPQQPSLNSTGLSNTGSFELEPRRDISQPHAVTPKRKPRASAAAARTERSPTGAHAKLGKLLVEAMGMDAKALSAEEHIEITEQVGELMPVIVQGMMNILRSRASIKNEFRMSVTTIQPVENNPLKFSADTQEALENMFVRKSRAYKGPVEAFSESFDAIAEHQVAIIAGIRAAFESMLGQFNPESLEHQFDKHSKGVSIPGMQKARYWGQYAEHYESVIDNMEQSFQSLFGDEFVRAYEDQLFKLVAARNKI